MTLAQMADAINDDPLNLPSKQAALDYQENWYAARDRFVESFIGGGESV